MNLDFKTQISKLISDTLQFPVEPIFVIPENLDHGDLSTNVALVLCGNKDFQQQHAEFSNPRVLAEAIKSEIENCKLEVLSKVEVAGPGFINFYFSQSALNSVLNQIKVQGERFGYDMALQGKNVMVEFTDPNPLKEFHIGHLYSNTVGEALSRLFESQSAEVWRVCYQGDVGLHVAKAVFGICKRLENENLQLDLLGQQALFERAKFLGQAYSLGAKAYDEDENAKQEIIDINKKIYEKDPEFYSIYDTAKKWSLEYFDSLYQRLGTHFRRYYFESEAGARGMMVVRDNMNKVFKEDQGSIIFPKEISGLHTRVFVNSQGLPTYEAKELGLAPWKYEEFPYDLSVIVTGNEINEYFKVLLKALSFIRPDLAERTKHISHGMVRLPGGKMSSRTGDVITGDDLLNNVRDSVFKKIKGEDRITEESADVIGVGAIKYSLLRSSIGKDVVFNIDESISLDGNSGPYIQYTFVRTQSVLAKSEKSEVKSQSEGISNFEEQEKNLTRVLVQFPDIVKRAADDLSPSDVCTYLYTLSKEFNLFYEKNKIIGNEREDIRLRLTAAVGQVVKNGLYLLGIQTVEKM